MFKSRGLFYTPGPWSLIRPDDHPGMKPRIETREKLVAEVGNAEDWQDAFDEWEANACLIAAAPDLHRNSLEFYRFSLVIESAIRHADRPHHEDILALLKSTESGLRKAEWRKD